MPSGIDGFHADEKAKGAVFTAPPTEVHGRHRPVPRLRRRRVQRERPLRHAGAG
jgi:hypothetical protein